jgi:hypothetical protein
MQMPPKSELHWTTTKASPEKAEATQRKAEGFACSWLAMMAELKRMT